LFVLCGSETVKPTKFVVLAACGKGDGCFLKNAMEQAAKSSRTIDEKLANFLVKAGELFRSCSWGAFFFFK